MSEPKVTDKYLHVNHGHELTDDHEWVDFGDGAFIANKAAIPLLQALNELGLRTRTHHVDDTGGFVSVLLDDSTRIEIKPVFEKDATRTKYNGRFEVLIMWNKPITRVTCDIGFNPYKNEQTSPGKPDDPL